MTNVTDPTFDPAPCPHTMPGPCSTCAQNAQTIELLKRMAAVVWYCEHGAPTQQVPLGGRVTLDGELLVWVAPADIDEPPATVRNGDMVIEHAPS